MSRQEAAAQPVQHNVESRIELQRPLEDNSDIVSIFGQEEVDQDEGVTRTSVASQHKIRLSFGKGGGRFLGNDELEPSEAGGRSDHPPQGKPQHSSVSLMPDLGIVVAREPSGQVHDPECTGDGDD